MRAHVFLCMLAYYLEWNLRARLAPMLYDDDDKAAAESLRETPVAKAQRSPKALAKSATGRTADGAPVHSLLALVTIYEGGARADAARLGGVELQTIRDWVLRFNAKGPDGLNDGKSTGRPSKLDDEQRRALVAMVEAGPIPAIHEVVRWRLIDLAQWLFDEYGLSVSKQVLSRELRALEYRKLSARPRHHEHDEAAVAAFKKKVQTSWRISPRHARQSDCAHCRLTPQSDYYSSMEITDASAHGGARWRVEALACWR